MRAKIIFIESTGDFSETEKSRIIKLTEKIFLDSAKVLGVKIDINFTFYRFGKKNSGFTQAKDWIAVTLPKGKIDYIDLEGMLYHELHHVVRGYTGYLESGKHYLLNSMFSEGLATAFEIEKQNKERKTTHHTYTPALIKKWLPQTKKELYTTYTYDYAGWFKGVGKPKQLGYKLGKYLVDQIQKNHPTLSHKELVTKDARELLKLSGVKF